MKKIFAAILALTLMLSVIGLFASCGHKHTFDQENTDAAFLSEAATNKNPAVYFYSCECGEVGTETFTYGDRIKTDWELFFEEITEEEPESVTAVITTVNAGVTVTATTTLSEDANTVAYTLLNKLDINNPDTTMTTTETLAAKAGENTININTLDFSLENFEEEPDVKAKEMTATITNPSAFFGATITTYTSAEITIEANHGALSTILITYTTTSGSQVTINITFA